MRSCGLWCAAGILLSLVGQSSLNAQTKVTVGKVRDTRMEGKHPSGMQVFLTIEDAALLQDVKSYRIVPTKASDDLGTDLLDTTRHVLTESYQPFLSPKGLSVRLVSPPRRATVIRELTGEIQFFVPRRDPSASVIIASFSKQPAGPIASPLLAAAGVELNLPEQTVSGIANKGVVSASNATLPSTVQTPSGYSIRLSYTDPNERVVGLEFADAGGNTIRPPGSGLGHHGAVTTRHFHFRDELADSTNLIVYLATPLAVVKVPFALTNIPLP